jgi:membrane-associated protease RseP (regulator of RpoE activity)
MIPPKSVALCVALLCATGIVLAHLNLGQAQDKPKDELKKEKLKPIPFPDIEKLLPQGLDPDQVKEIKKQLEKAQEDARKALEDIQKQFPGGFANAGMRFGAFGGNRLGAALTRPSDVLVEQLDLPKDQGLILNRVMPNSAAAKAGLKNNDILLELGGKKVSSQPGEFMKALNEYKTGDKVDAVVLRKGKKETVKNVTLPEVPKNAFPGFDGFPRFQIQPNGGIQIDGLPKIPNNNR